MPVSISIKKSQKQPVLLKYRVKCQDRTGSRDCDIKILPDRKTLTIRPVGDIKETFDLADDNIKIRNLKTGRLDEIKDESSKNCLVLSTKKIQYVQKRYYGHRHSFTNREQEHSTTFSTYVWHL